MDSRRSYTLSELETESGFDKRTIAYYIAEGLLPKVGRRGPRTRYPQECLQRLMFIRRVRDLQDAGRLGAVTLTDIRAVMDRLTIDDIASAARSGVPVEAVQALFEVPAEETAMAAAMADSETGDDAWHAECLSAETASAAEKPLRLLSARRRRELLQSYDADRSATDDTETGMVSTAMRLPESPMARSVAIDERHIDELMRSMHRLAEKIEAANSELHAELREEIREMKDIVYRAERRLKDLEERARQDAEDGEDDPDAGGA